MYQIPENRSSDPLSRIDANIAKIFLFAIFICRIYCIARNRFRLPEPGGPKPPPAEARSFLFAALRRLRPEKIFRKKTAQSAPEQGFSLALFGGWEGHAAG